MKLQATGFMVALAILTMVHSTEAQANPCSFPNGDQTTTAELIANIVVNNASCALPWRALKREVSDGRKRRSIERALEEVAKRDPKRSKAVRSQKATVAAAAGYPQEMLAIADANVLASPEDKSLPNMSCFVRGRYGFDVDHAMPFCNAAVAAGRPLWALVNRGRVELALGLFKEALADFDEALAKEGSSGHSMVVDARFGRGVARLKLGDSGGNEDLTAALKARPTVAADFADADIRP
ncbi:tetratricopeptide repeat protein [Novosphingobium subterraneum]|uniref:Tetratricopeptide repeat protein n=1 Tax=Novosphingobium subterraneum TaxID=48936 RepID=A0A0B8Z8X9_9SPHN|nr:hypothetical protein [Novosphingobium subterraneum]KHS42661.1 hypothetical protein NJ75_04099 [Novosphingobium subterraneum]